MNRIFLIFLVTFFFSLNACNTKTKNLTDNQYTVIEDSLVADESGLNALVLLKLDTTGDYAPDMVVEMSTPVSQEYLSLKEKMPQDKIKISGKHIKGKIKGEDDDLDVEECYFLDETGKFEIEE